MQSPKKNKNRVDIYGERLSTRAPTLSPRLQTVLHYIDENRNAVLDLTALEIAAAVNTSDATVVRAVQALGFAGLLDLKKTLKQWFEPVINSEEKMHATVKELTPDINFSIDYVLESHKHACTVLGETHNRNALSQAVALLQDARQAAIFGLNASGILADYTARLFNRIGLSAYALNRTSIGLAEQLLALQRGDVLLMMVQESPHSEGMTTLREAKRLGIPVIVLTSALESNFAREADVLINVPRGAENDRMPLHGTVLVCLEMLVLSVATSASQRTIKSMKRMHELKRGLKLGGKKS
ncbi:MurR/RpiR family transcriptional regulator [Rahnella sp. SAP-1]|uniref:MurR/RpiR family transcriptional regulator n=1 Tax=Rouxiella aceris TaxID=2703884 RepID=A0A848MN50_9GAMM|nr:MurR/RpiR family transcriptional regulator [Rouxiella aceris]NMP27574.1 MurR/RpiR family transcriptional regulator [Rouxiella aceris]